MKLTGSGAPLKLTARNAAENSCGEIAEVQQCGLKVRLCVGSSRSADYAYQQ